MERPLVSIITLTWNRSVFLAQALESIRNQNYRNLEIVIVDDGSEDCTPELVRTFQDLRIVYFPLRHTGHLAKLRNFGLSQATGDFICCLDSDDLWAPDKLNAQLSALTTHPSAGFSFCGYETFDELGNHRIQLYRTRAEADQQQSIQNIFDRVITGAWPIYPSSLMLRRSALDRLGGLDESLRVGDYEFLSRLAFEYQAAIIHAPLVRIRKHADNISSQLEAQDLNEAITTIRRHYALGRIAANIHDERLLKYRCDLALAFFRKSEAADAASQLLACYQDLIHQ